MGSIQRFTRLSLVNSLLKIHANQRIFIPSTASCLHRLDSSVSSSSISSSSSQHPRKVLSLFNSCRKCSSFDGTNRYDDAFDSDSDEFPLRGKWSSSNSRRQNSFSQRHSRSRSFDPDFSRRPQRGRGWDEDADDHFSQSFNDRFQSGRLGANIKERDWNSSVLSPIEKNFYVLHPDVAERSNDVIENYYASHNITISRGEKPVPLSDFHEANFPEKIVRYLEGNSWSSPTPIQSLGWPIALSGKNMVGLAQTGSGKTLGFILPALVHIKHQRPVDRGEGPVVLVLAPTRELAQQIKSVAVEYGRLLGIRSCCIFGGQSKLVQARHISQGPELVVATPGRLLDFIESEVLDLGRTTFVVMDEADRMLDMGFEPQIRKILGQIRPDRQILMWSATWPKEIQQLAHDFLGDFTQINIGSQELTANPNIEQVVKVCEWKEKFGLVMDELEDQFSKSENKRVLKTLIFCRTKQTVDILAKKLWHRRLRVQAIHGDKSQSYRDNALQRFRDGKSDILVATDVAARGLDVDDIKVVINYDFPNSIDDYIHRIGRTARASKTGKAITFITDDDAGKVNDLIMTLKSAEQNVDPELYEMAKFHSKFSKKSSYKPRPNFNQRRPPRFNSYKNNRYRDDFDSWNR